MKGTENVQRLSLKSSAEAKSVCECVDRESIESAARTICSTHTRLEIVIFPTVRSESLILLWALGRVVSNENKFPFFF
jgi:hypothetical protein